MNLLITGAWRQASEHMETLEAMGHAVAYLPEENGTLPCDPAWVEGIIGYLLFQHHPIECFSNLRYIQLTSAGMDTIPMDYVQSHGITLHNARGIHSLPIAEFVLAAVLQHYKELPAFSAQQKAHLWEKRLTLRELAGKNVLIIGAGSIGSACAALFQAFGCTVVGIATRARTAPGFHAVCTTHRLPKLLPRQDIVVLTAPLTAETRGILGAEQLAQLKDGTLVVNVARGGLIDREALTRELVSGRLSAVLDVFETEPLASDSPLWDLPNVIITPHNSFCGDHTLDRMWQMICNNLTDFQESERAAAK